MVMAIPSACGNLLAFFQQMVESLKSATSSKHGMEKRGLVPKNIPHTISQDERGTEKFVSVENPPEGGLLLN